MTRRAVLTLILNVVFASSLFANHGHAAVPLAVSLSSLQMVAPGRVGFDVVISGLRPELQPTIEGSANLGGQSIQGPPGPVVAARIPASIDLLAGRVRVGGDAFVAEFPPMPPVTENTPIALEVTVRQGDEVATARQTGVLLLPTVIVPGYLNDMSGKPDPRILSVLEQRGYRARGTSPDLFWFTYPSRSLSLEKGAWALAAYVRDVVLPKTYAARINVVGYSLGGLLTRWALAFEPGWDRLVNRFVMVGVPNEGAVMAYVNAWYPLAAPWARTPAARDLLPTFPFWRPARGAPWGFPPDAQNAALAELNTHPLPEGIRAYAFFGYRPLDEERRSGTWAGVTGQLPEARFSYGPGDGIVLAASALGLPINGGAGVPGLADRLANVDLGPIGHQSLMEAAIMKIAEILTDNGAGGPIGRQRRAEGARELGGFNKADNPFFVGTGTRPRY